MPRIFQPSWTHRTPQWIIFDLDGTLADITHRLHHIQPIDPYADLAEFTPDWDKFNHDCYKDQPKSHIVGLAQMARQYGKSIAIFSGRMETAKEQTIKWLEKHGVEYDILEMRKSKDYRSDVDVKEEMFNKHFEPKQIWFVVDDRDKVVDLWRRIGLTCLQCQKGDY